MNCQNSYPNFYAVFFENKWLWTLYFIVWKCATFIVKNFAVKKLRILFIYLMFELENVLCCLGVSVCVLVRKGLFSLFFFHHHDHWIIKHFYNNYSQIRSWYDSEEKCISQVTIWLCLIYGIWYGKTCDKNMEKRKERIHCFTLIFIILL